MKRTVSKLASAPAPIRIGAFLATLLVLWLPIAALLPRLIKDSNTVSTLTLVILYVEFMLLVSVWGRWVYRQPNLFQRYGLEFSQRMGLELLVGLLLGATSLLALFATEGLLGWVVWQFPSIAFWQVVLQGLLVALGVGFAEELFFRGWLLDELQRDCHPQVALWVNATLYAMVHGIKPQFPALLLLGLTLVWAKRSCRDSVRRSHWEPASNSSSTLCGRLGLPMGLHAGLVWGYYMVNVGKLVTSNPQVPEWLIGFDRNPLAGAIGIVFLSGLAIGMEHYARRK